MRGLLQPVLDQYAVGFLPVHGFSSATAVHDIAQDDDGRPLIILYVGDRAMRDRRTAGAVTRATSGSSPTTESVVGSLTRWTLTRFASASNRPSSNGSSR